MKKNKLGLSGKFSSGKTTIANKFVEEYGYLRIAIADNIKWVCNELIQNINNIKLFVFPEDTSFYHFFNKTLEMERDKTLKTIKMLADAMSDFVDEKERHWITVPEGYMKNDDYRELTQMVGTLLRDNFGSDVWVNWYLKVVYQREKEGFTVVCDDVRLQSEKEALENNGFVVVRLDVNEEIQNERHLKLYGKKPDEKRKNHITEMDLDDADFILRIDNSYQTIEETFNIVKKVVKNHERITVS